MSVEAAIFGFGLSLGFLLGFEAHILLRWLRRRAIRQVLRKDLAEGAISPNTARRIWEREK